MREILVINPNSSLRVTNDIKQAIACVDAHPDFSFRCERLEDAPEGIETDEHVQSVIPMLMDMVSGTRYDGYVLACFSDPGIAEIRRKTGKAVFGIGECSYLQAMSAGSKFGIVSIGPESRTRQLRYLETLGFSGRLAESIPLMLSVAELSSAGRARDRIVEVSDALVRAGAEVVILGCAGMFAYHEFLKQRVGVPVVEPTMAAVSLVLQSRYFSPCCLPVREDRRSHGGD